jgi:glycosyltransferase involved in cell wall biosynthesis
VPEPSGRPLHIGVDAREVTGKPTGVGRHLEALLTRWAAQSDMRHRVTLFSPAALPRWVQELGGQVRTVVEARGRAGTLWEQLVLPGLIERAGLDVLLAPGYTSPLRAGCPVVVVIHDVSFFAHPEWFTWREGIRRRWLTRAAARRAANVITVSEFSASEIERWLGIPRDRVTVVPHGSPPLAMPEQANRPRVVLFVGTLFNRRRLPELIGGFARARQHVPDARLILVGDNRTSPRLDPRELAGRAGVQGVVDWREYVNDAELMRLYDSARVFAFLSDYEGFGLTPMEALAHGAPLVLLDTPVAREIYEPAAWFVPPREDAIGDALARLLADDAEHTRLVAAGHELLRRYSWERAAEQVLHVLEAAAG